MTADVSWPRRLFLPPVACLGSGLLMFALDRVIPSPRLVHSSAAWLGWLPVAAAVVLAGAAILTFRRAETTPHPWGEPSALVTAGPYRLSRNPMYLALLLILCGWWLALGTPAALVGLPVFVAVVDRAFIRREERLLDACFGEAFRAYRQRVRRWL